MWVHARAGCVAHSGAAMAAETAVAGNRPSRGSVVRQISDDRVGVVNSCDKYEGTVYVQVFTEGNGGSMHRFALDNIILDESSDVAPWIAELQWALLRCSKGDVVCAGTRNRP